MSVVPRAGISGYCTRPSRWGLSIRLGAGVPDAQALAGPGKGARAVAVPMPVVTRSMVMTGLQHQVTAAEREAVPRLKAFSVGQLPISGTVRPRLRAVRRAFWSTFIWPCSGKLHATTSPASPGRRGMDNRLRAHCRSGSRQGLNK